MVVKITGKEIAKMVVIVIEKASEKLRGELTRWLMEARPGTFVGTVNAVVR